MCLIKIKIAHNNWQDIECYYFIFFISWRFSTYLNYLIIKTIEQIKVKDKKKDKSSKKISYLLKFFVKNLIQTKKLWITLADDLVVAEKFHKLSVKKMFTTYYFLFIVTVFK